MANSTNLPALNEALGALQDELMRLKVTVDLLDQNKEAAREVVLVVTKVTNAVDQLVGPTQSLVTQVGNIDFPVRLDKIDEAMNMLEHNLKDDICDIRSDMSSLGKVMQALNQSVENMHKENEKMIRLESGRLMNFNWILLFFLVINIGAITFLIIRH